MGNIEYLLTNKKSSKMEQFNQTNQYIKQLDYK